MGQLDPKRIPVDDRSLAKLTQRIGRVPEVAQVALTQKQLETQEAQAFDEASGQFMNMLRARPELASLSSAMVAIRRCFYFAVDRLDEILAEFPETSPLVTDLVIQSTAADASEEFTDARVVEQMRLVLAWLAFACEQRAHKKEQEHKLAEASNQSPTAVATKDPVDVGLVLGVTQGTTISRERSLILAGEPDAIRALAFRMAEAASEGLQVVAILDTHAATMKTGGSGDIRILPTDDWAGMADNRPRAIQFARYLFDSLGGRSPDLIVCTDLAALCDNRGFIGRPDAAVAGDGHRALRRVADNFVGRTAVIGLCPIHDQAELEKYGIDGPEYEQLRSHSDLRLVTREPNGVRFSGLFVEISPEEFTDAGKREHVSIIETV